MIRPTRMRRASSAGRNRRTLARAFRVASSRRVVYRTGGWWAAESETIRGVERRESRWLVWIEGAVVLALTAGHDFVPLSATPFFLALGWISLRLRGLTWRDVGLARKHSWLVTLGLGSLAGIAMELLSTFVTVPFFS